MMTECLTVWDRQGKLFQPLLEYGGEKVETLGMDKVTTIQV